MFAGGCGAFGVLMATFFVTLVSFSGSAKDLEIGGYVRCPDLLLRSDVRLCVFAHLQTPTRPAQAGEAAWHEDDEDNHDEPDRNQVVEDADEAQPLDDPEQQNAPEE